MDMKEFFAKLFYQNTISDWGMSIGIVVLSLILGKAIFWFIKRILQNFTAKTRTKVDDILLDMLDEPFVFSIVAWGIHIGLTRLKLPEVLETFIDRVFFGFLTFMATWFVVRTMDKFIDVFLVPLAEKTNNDFDDHLLPVVKKTVNLGIWILGIVVALNNAGFDVGALIAGMELGGLAFAMAAKDTVSNFFGGVTVFVDKPFRIGDRIKISDIDGTVVEIGLRSTRIKTLEGRIVTIPNAQFAGGIVENVSWEPSRKVIINLGLTYDTNSNSMKEAMDILKDIISKNKDTEEDIKISFNSWGDFSLGILLIYYIKKGEDIFQIQTDINLEILARFNDRGLAFAFPTQTLDIPKGGQVNI